MTFAGGRGIRSNRVAALAGLSLLACGTGLKAQTQGGQAASAIPSPAANVSVPAGPLESGILSLGRQINLRLLYPSSLTAGKRTNGVSGRLGPREAVTQLLAGTGLRYSFTGANTVQISNASAGSAVLSAPEGAIPLDTIDVQGDGAFGPTNGFISQDSVAGSKTNTPIMETPYSVSVVNRKQLETQNPQSLPDALRYVPGVATGFFGSDTRILNSQIYIRGFGNDASQFYWNGLTLPGDSYINSPTLDPHNLERIEVLKGPASVLYGQASPGGIINARSKRPSETPIREITVGTGNYGRMYGAFDLGGPIDKDGQWLYRISGVGYRTGTQIDDTTNERVSIAPSLTWRPSADTKLTILTTYQRDPDAVGFQSLPLVGTLLPSKAGPIPTRLNFGEPSYDRLDRTSASVGYEFKHRFNEVWTIRQNARYIHAHGSYREIQPTGDTDATNTVMSRWNWGTNGRLDAAAVDNQIQAQFSTGPVKHTVLMGLDYKNQWTYLEHYWSRNGVPSLDILNPVYGLPIPAAPMIANTKGRLEQTGVYAQDQIAIGNWRFLIGGRQDWAETSSTNLRTIVNPTTTQRSQAFTWRTGAVYLFDNGLAPYASYATSFQPQSGTDFGGAMFKPTTAQQYEVGIKYQPVGLRSFVQASLFDLTQQNVLTSDPEPTHAGFSVQTGEVRVRGVELSASLALMDNFNLIASYTYNALQTTKANVDTTGFDPTGRVPWYYPKQIASLWADYKFESGTVAGLRIGGGVRYVGSSYNGPHQLYTVPDYTVFDAVINYDLGAASASLRGWELGINANNLFDKIYLARCSEINCSYGIRRTILANLKYRW